MNANHIYTITTIKIDEHLLNAENLIPSTYYKNRCVGFYFSFEDAEKVVLGNYGDINECGYYTIVVIERFYEGLYPICDKEDWYQFINDKYQHIQKPTCFKNIVNFGIG